ncbi:MAG: tetratricopeptide repeat protein [Pedosphaera sp.]|nr:tetratricopeptide repeat protein [Pedosphaera sp.]
MPSLFDSSNGPSLHESVRLRSRRLLLFRIAAVATPLVLLLLAEVGLRLAGRHVPASFWLKSTEPGWIETNPHFGDRYLGPTLARMPRPIRIRATKAAGSLRVLVLGESAALGDPEPTFGLSRFLQAQLEVRFPSRSVEVINASITALNSYAIRDIALDSQSLGADIWIIYPGNNEVHGPFGPGSGPTVGVATRGLILVNLALRRSAIGQWLAALHEFSGAGLSLAQRFAGLEMFTRNQVPASDPRLAQVRQHFATNLKDILQYGAQSGAKVFVGTMAVNLTDSAPFASEELLPTNAPVAREWRLAFDSARHADEQTDPLESIQTWSRAVALAPAHAESRFRLGLAQLTAGKLAAGRADLEAARDLDSLRFRADSGLIAATRSIAAQLSSEGITLVDADRDLRGDDPNRPPGADLFYEHVHLRPEGNRRLALLFTEAITRQFPNTNALRALGFELKRLGWNSPAEFRIWTQIRSLCARPPFSQQSQNETRNRFIDDRLTEASTEMRRVGLNTELNKIETVLEEHPHDWELREQAARLLHQGRRWTNAASEWRRIIADAPGHVVAWYHLGEALSKSEDRLGAIAAYRRALVIRPDFTDASIGLGINLGQSGQLEAAFTTLSSALAFEPKHPELRINRAITLNALGRFDEATKDWLQAATDNPTSPLPLIRLAEAYSARKEFLPAVESLALAVKREPRNVALNHRLATELGRADRLPDSEAAFRKTLILDPTFISARVDLGVALAQQKRFSDAIVEFEIVLRQQPAHPSATVYLERARAMLLQRKKI